MPFTYTLPPFHTQPATDPDDPLELGEDVCMIRGSLTITPAGDWGTVSGVMAARQSVMRELPANPGSFVHRPSWGGGLAGLLFKGNTPAVRDQAAAQARSRLRVNPRITKIGFVAAGVTDEGFALTVRAEAAGGPLEIENEVIKP